MTNQVLHLNGIEYEIIDSIQDLRAEDSFIHSKNKLQMFRGNGEARKYVGSYKGESGENLANFFGYKKWGECKNEKGERFYEIISKNCFFSKKKFIEISGGCTGGVF